MNNTEESHTIDFLSIQIDKYETALVYLNDKATLHISACVFLKLKKNYLYDKLNNFCKVCGIIIKTSTFRESQGIMVR